MENPLVSQSNDKLANCFTPSELIGIFRDALIVQKVNAKVIYVKGIYKIGSNCKFINYDILCDDQAGCQITIYISTEQKSKVKNGNLVLVAGIVERKLNIQGYIQLILNVSRIDILEDVAVKENDLRVFELHKKKQAIGYKEVETIIKSKIYASERPLIGLLFAGGSIVDAEFGAALSTAASCIDFKDYRVSFAQVVQFNNKIKEMDGLHFDAIALLRGGGSGLDFFDDPNILEVIIGLKTPIISAIGHRNEKFYLKDVADKVVDTPTALGIFFRDIVEQVSEQKSKSKSVLMVEIRKQFIDQINIQVNQNQSLSLQLKDMAAASKSASDKYYTQIASLQKQLKEITEGNEKKDAIAHKQTKDLTDQIKKMIDDKRNQDDILYKQREQLDKQLRDSQIKIDGLTSSLANKDRQINDMSNKKSGCLGMAAVFIGVIIMIAALL